jgi:hypothetical protein
MSQEFYQLQKEISPNNSELKRIRCYKVQVQALNFDTDDQRMRLEKERKKKEKILSVLLVSFEVFSFLVDLILVLYLKNSLFDTF